MEQGNNNRVRNILIAVIIVLITGTIFSIGFYIFSTQSKMARLEKEREQKPNIVQDPNMISIKSVKPEVANSQKKDSYNNTQSRPKTMYEKAMINRMASVENELNSYTPDNTSSCDEYVGYRVSLHNKWDNELNQIYKMLMASYPDSQKKFLKNEEIAWIKERERTIDGIRSEASDDCSANIEIENREIDTIKARAIELAEKYDRLN
ncbi:lysozyme inhibitor LprI family protein [uncultured Leptotrichia sp.]|uniref:lysozyme inhibitor LprI family protein n=1 Tax=uncultured Leptotrichia sp. TaxID=159271 RepID=UPI0025D86443|nr:lysozyme inhibitor LprI family protein [uncultured Leptotrichia sp.]